MSLVEVAELINKFDPSTEGKECIEMGVDGKFFIASRVLFLIIKSLLGLREMLLSDENQLMKPEHRNTVYQDMTKPLTDYWINTSHNT